MTRILLLMLVCALASPPAAASSLLGTRITKVLAHRNGHATITTANVPTGQPVCDIIFPPRAGDNYYAFDMTSNVGKALYATVVLAYATQSTVDVVGTNSCFNYINITAGTEALSSVRLVP
jgi:hypothetical protein